MKIATHPVPVSSPPAWISSLHDGWRTRKQNTNCKNVADSPPSHASLCTGLLSCRSIHAVHPLLSWIVNWVSRYASGSVTFSRSRRKRSKNIRDVQTRTERIPDDGSVREGSRYDRLPVRTATGRVLFLRFLRLSDGGERSVGRSVGPSVRLGSWRTSDLSSDSAEEASPVLRVSSFSATLSSTLAMLSLSPQPSSPRGLLHRFLSHPATVSLFSSPYATSVVTPPALPPSSASSSCRYRYHYHCPRHYHRRGGVDDASSSAFSWPSPPAESTWWLPHHLGDPAPLSTNDQRLSLLRGANRAHGSSRDLSPLCSWASVLPASLLVAYAVSSEAEDAGGRLTTSLRLVNNETYHALDRYFSRKLRLYVASFMSFDNCHDFLARKFEHQWNLTCYLKSMLMIGTSRLRIFET